LALAAMDEAFAGIRGVGRVDGCGRCYSEEELRLLGGDPALVPEGLVGHFAQKHAGHWSDAQYAQMWQGLAPRIVRQLLDAPTPEWMLRGLASPESHFHTWSAARSTSLLDALGVALDIAMTDGRSYHHVDNLLEALSDAAPLTDWLGRIERLDGHAADAGFVRLAFGWATEFASGGDLDWSFFDPEHDPTDVARDWLCTPAVADRLLRWLTAHPRCKTAADTTIAVDAVLRGDNQGIWLRLLDSDDPRCRSLSWLTSREPGAPQHRLRDA
jgi:hypothetical protein